MRLNSLFCLGKKGNYEKGKLAAGPRMGVGEEVVSVSEREREERREEGEKKKERRRKEVWKRFLFLSIKHAKIRAFPSSRSRRQFQSPVKSNALCIRGLWCFRRAVKRKRKKKKEKEGINSELSPWRVTCCMHPPFLIFPRVSSPDPIAHNWIINEGLLPKSVHGTIFKNKADRWPGRFYLASRGLRVGGARKRWFPNNGTFEKLNDHGWWIRNGGEQNNVSPLEFVKRVIWLRTIGGDAEKKNK